MPPLATPLSSIGARALLTSLFHSLVSTAKQVFLEPLPLLLLLSGLALANLWRVRAGTRRRLLLLTIPYLALVAVSLPIASYFLMGSLEWSHPPLDGQPSGADAIVVLSGGIKGPAVGQTPPELSESSVRRCLSRPPSLYHQGPRRPVIVTGGMFDSDSPDPARRRAHGRAARTARRAEVRRDHRVQRPEHLPECGGDPENPP